MSSSPENLQVAWWSGSGDEGEELAGGSPLPRALHNHLSLLFTEHSAPAKVVRAATPKQRKGSKVRLRSGQPKRPS